MAKINQRLLEVIAEKRGISIKSVYSQISKVVGETFLENDLAALVLATRNNIGINRYSTPEQRAAIRSFQNGGSAAAPAPFTPASSSPVRDVVRGKVVKSPKTKKVKGNSVFVVHGRDALLRKGIFEFLRSLGLNPMEWEHAVQAAKGNNPNIGDIINTAMAQVQAVIVMFSPDENAQLKQQFWNADDRTGDGKLAGQARPNVIFEAGLALGAHPEKTIIVQVGKLRPFSDIAGKHLVKLSNSTSSRNDLASRLQKIGCTVDRTGSDWMTTGNFVPTPPKVSKAIKKRSLARRLA